jgi:hypothetical protein
MNEKAPLSLRNSGSLFYSAYLILNEREAFNIITSLPRESVLRKKLTDVNKT